MAGKPANRLARAAGRERIPFTAVAAPREASAQFVPYYGKNKVKYDNFAWRIYKSPHFEVFYDLLRTAEEAGEFLENPAIDRERPTPHPVDDPLIGASVGRYRVLGVIGSGGMGVVYRAEQEKPRRQVALKLIRRGRTRPGRPRQKTWR